ncbi:MAG: cation-transporting P-type ATPase [Candidatus Bathyarchaeia archaeon]
MMDQDLEMSSVGEVSGWALPSDEEVLTLPVEELLSRLKTSLNGLSSEEVERRLEYFGYNELVRKKRRAAIIDFLFHFKSPLVIILLIAGLISSFFGDVVNTVIVFVIVLFSVILDFYQESKAERAAEMLKQRVATTATVLRDGVKKEVRLAEIVPGDIIFLSAGDIVPADARVISAKDLFVNQSALTGDNEVGQLSFYGHLRCERDWNRRCRKNRQPYRVWKNRQETCGKGA